MNDPLAYVDFGEHAAAPSSDKLQELTALVEELELAETALSEAEAVLAQRQARLRGIMEHELPELMLELKQPILHTSDGRKIEVKDVVRASLPAPRRPMGHQWLIENGHAGLVKRTVEVAFAAVEGDKANELLHSMEESFGGNARQVMKVEAQSLLAFIRKQLEREADPSYDGPKLPTDIFEVREFKQAKVTGKKK